MNWFEYTEGLKVLFFRFGSYSKPEIDSGFKQWKHETSKSFNTWIMEQTSRPFINQSKPKKSKEVVPRIYVHDELSISDNYLDSLKKKHGVDSLIELVEKMKVIK